MVYAVIVDSVVTNLVVAEESFAVAQGWIQVANEVQRGWLYLGGEFSPPNGPPEVPESVTMLQARLALLQASLLPTVEAAVVNLPEADKLAWEFAGSVQRESALVLQLGAGLGLTAAEIDALFVLAAAL